MADNIWEGNGGTKFWSTAGDWSLNHVPQAGEDVIFNGTGSASCLIDVSTAAILSLTMTSVEIITVSIDTAITVTVTGTFSIEGGTFDVNAETLDVGSFNVGVSVTLFDAGGAAAIAVSGGCTVADVASIATFSGSTLTIDGTGNLYNPRSTNAFGNLILSGSIVTTMTNNVQVNGMFTTGTGTINGGSYTLDLGNGLTNEGPTWGTAGVLCFCSTSGTHSVPGDDYSPWSIESRNDTAVYNQTESVTAVNFIGTGENDWNLSGYNLTLTGSLQVGGTNPGLDGFVVSVGTGTLEVAGNVSLQGADALQNQIDGGSGTVKVGGNWTVDTGDTVDPDFIPGTSTVIFDGSSTQTVTSGGVDLGDVDVACSGTVDMADAFQCAAFDLQSGAFDTGGFTMAVTSWLLTAGTFTATTSTVTCTGSCERVGGTLSGASATWDLTGSGNLRNNNLTTPFGLVKCAATSQTTTLSNTCVAKKWEFGTGVLTASGSYEFSVYQPAGGKVITNAGVTIDASGGTNPNYHHWYGAGGQGFTYDPVNFGSGNIAVDPGTNTYFDLLGHWTTTGSFTYSAASNGSNFDLNGFNLTCGAILLSGSGSNTQVLYCGEGTVDCTSFATGALAGVTTLNLESCTFQCFGDFTMGHVNHVISRGTSEIVLDGSGAQAIDFLGEWVNDLTVTNIGGTVSFTDAMDVQGTFKPGNGGSTVTIRFSTTGTHHWEAVDTSAASGTGTIDLNSVGEAASWALTLGSNQTVTSVDVTYSNLTGFTIDATDSTNVDGGNNSANWNFAAVGQDVPQKMNSYRRRRVCC